MINKKEQMNKLKYGMFRGYYCWDLAKAWLTMTNDDFYNLYGFNWVPELFLREEVRKYI